MAFDTKSSGRCGIFAHAAVDPPGIRRGMPRAGGSWTGRFRSTPAPPAAADAAAAGRGADAVAGCAWRGRAWWRSALAHRGAAGRGRPSGRWASGSDRRGAAGPAGVGRHRGAALAAPGGQAATSSSAFQVSADRGDVQPDGPGRVVEHVVLQRADDAGDRDHDADGGQRRAEVAGAAQAGEEPERDGGDAEDGGRRGRGP